MATKPRALPERSTSASIGSSAFSTASKRSADDQAPQQRRPGVPVLGARARARRASSSGPAASSRRSAREHHRHPLRDGERLAALPEAAGRRGARAPARPGRAARVVKAADDELALEPSGERLVGLTELRERTLDHVHRVHPPEQRRVRFGHLERDLGALSRICGQA